MKTKFFFALACAMCLVFTNCEKTGPSISDDDVTKFNTNSIVGVWVAVDTNNEVEYYYDITSNRHLYYVDQIFDVQGRAVYNPSDGYLHTTQTLEWNQSGDLTYTFDEAKQVIRCHTGTIWGFDAKAVISMLGSDEIFDTRRIGLNEGYIYDKTGWLKDAHVYRIKGVIKDLQ